MNFEDGIPAKGIPTEDMIWPLAFPWDWQGFWVDG